MLAGCWLEERSISQGSREAVEVEERLEDGIWMRKQQAKECWLEKRLGQQEDEGTVVYIIKWQCR